MAIEILKLAIIMTCVMIMMRFIFVEIDGRTAIKRSNIAYFLNLSDKFKYKRIGNNFILIGLALMFFTEIDLTTSEGLIYFLVFFAISIIADFISSVAYHHYGKNRYQSQINEAKKFYEKLSASINQKVNGDDAYVYGQDYQFEDVIKDYIYPTDHFVCLSADGGELMQGLETYPQVAFLVDRKQSEAKLRMSGTPVRVTTLTKDHRYPFKDERMDVVACYNENFSPEEGKRILKNGGTLIINQLGSENLLELYTFLGPRIFAGNWNLENLKKGLRNHGYQILTGHEERAEIRFRTLAAFYEYIKDMAFVKADDLKRYVNQFFMIHTAIEKYGFYAMKTHRFYVVARKDNVV